MSATRWLKMALALGMVTLISACGGGGGGGGGGTAASGAVDKGIMKSGRITAVELNADGTTKKIVGTAFTDEYGQYELTISGHTGGAVLVTVEADPALGTRMVCDSTTDCNFGGVNYTLGQDMPVSTGFVMKALLGTFDAGQPITVQVTPFTHGAALAALNEASTAGADVTPALADTSNARVGAMIGGIDIIGAQLINVADPDAVAGSSTSQQLYAYLNAAIMRLAFTHYASEPDPIAAALAALFANLSDGTANATDGGVDGTISITEVFDAAIAEATDGGNADAATELTTLKGTPADLALYGDTDGDTIPDYADNCPNVANAAQTDTDGDGVGDLCDAFAGDAAEWADTDADTVGDNTDNCPNDANAAQTDTDGDGVGDACDLCDDSVDGDGDGVGDACDNCTAVPNADQTDSDNDGTGDACEAPGGGAAVTSFNDLDVTGGSYIVHTPKAPGDPATVLLFAFQAGGTFAWSEIDDTTNAVVSATGGGTWTVNGNGTITLDTRTSGIPTTATLAVRGTPASDALTVYITITEGGESQNGVMVPGAGIDADVDAIPQQDNLLNPIDNCPAAPNTSQSDFDGINGGDACDNPGAGVTVTSFADLTLNDTLWQMDDGGGDTVVNMAFRTGGAGAWSVYAVADGSFLAGGQAESWSVDMNNVLRITVRDRPQDQGEPANVSMWLNPDALNKDDYLYVKINDNGALGDAVLVPLAAADTDQDSVVDTDDNCPAVPNPVQRDLDGDAVGDACPFGLTYSPAVTTATELSGGLSATEGGFHLSRSQTFHTPGEWGYFTFTLDGTPALTLNANIWDGLAGAGGDFVPHAFPFNDQLVLGSGGWAVTPFLPGYAGTNADGTVNVTGGTGAPVDEVVAADTAPLLGQAMAPLVSGAWVDPMGAATFADAASELVVLHVRRESGLYSLWYEPEGNDGCPYPVQYGGNCNHVTDATGSPATALSQMVVPAPVDLTITGAPTMHIADNDGTGDSLMAVLVGTGTTPGSGGAAHLWTRDSGGTFAYTTVVLHWTVVEVNGEAVLRLTVPHYYTEFFLTGWMPNQDDPETRILAVHDGFVRQGGFAPAGHVTHLPMLNQAAMDELIAQFKIGVDALLPQYLDDDGDGWANNEDNCPNVANAAQVDTDGDGTGDACDTEFTYTQVDAHATLAGGGIGMTEYDVNNSVEEWFYLKLNLSGGNLGAGGGFWNRATGAFETVASIPFDPGSLVYHPETDSWIQGNDGPVGTVTDNGDGTTTIHDKAYSGTEMLGSSTVDIKTAPLAGTAVAEATDENWLWWISDHTAPFSAGSELALVSITRDQDNYQIWHETAAGGNCTPAEELARNDNCNVAWAGGTEAVVVEDVLSATPQTPGTSGWRGVHVESFDGGTWLEAELLTDGTVNYYLFDGIGSSLLDSGTWEWVYGVGSQRMVRYRVTNTVLADPAVVLDNDDSGWYILAEQNGFLRPGRHTPAGFTYGWRMYNHAAVDDIAALFVGPGPVVDSDGDGVPDEQDNCPLAANVDQADDDFDGWGDACDGALGDGGAAGDLSDGDGVDDLFDNCVGIGNPLQQDSDLDGVGDACQQGAGAVVTQFSATDLLGGTFALTDTNNPAETTMVRFDAGNAFSFVTMRGNQVNDSFNGTDWSITGGVLTVHTTTASDGAVTVELTVRTDATSTTDRTYYSMVYNTLPAGDGVLIQMPDADADTVPDPLDNCPATANGPVSGAIQQDTDGDGVGDACESGQTVSGTALSTNNIMVGGMAFTEQEDGGGGPEWFAALLSHVNIGEPFDVTAYLWNDRMVVPQFQAAIPQFQVNQMTLDMSGGNAGWVPTADFPVPSDILAGGEVVLATREAGGVTDLNSATGVLGSIAADGHPMAGYVDTGWALSLGVPSATFGASTTVYNLSLTKDVDDYAFDIWDGCSDPLLSSGNCNAVWVGYWATTLADLDDQWTTVEESNGVWLEVRTNTGGTADFRLNDGGVFTTLPSGTWTEGLVAGVTIREAVLPLTALLDNGFVLDQDEADTVFWAVESGYVRKGFKTPVGTVENLRLLSPDALNQVLATFTPPAP